MEEFSGVRKDKGQFHKEKRLVWMFLGLLFLSSAAGVKRPQQVFSQTENRYLQTIPSFTWKSFLDGSFGRNYEAYLSDQFAGRDAWIGFKVTVERLMMKADVNQVYFGKDGYLIEKFDTVDMEQEQLYKNLDRLARFSDSARLWLGDEHIRIMLVPSASQILTDKLPPLAAPYNQGQIVNMLTKRTGEELVVLVEEELKQHKNQEIYYRTDHHWTALGAYYGYVAWAKDLGMTPVNQEEFLVKRVSRDFLGTIFSKVNVYGQKDSIDLFIPVKMQEFEVYYDGLETKYDSLYQYEALEGKNQYNIYLDGNHGLTKIVNKTVSEEGKGKTLMVIKDSFAHSFVPFAVHHFETTYMVDLRYMNVKTEEFARELGVTDMLILYHIPGFVKEKSVQKL